MDMSLFTSFEGRINRQKWWLGVIALMVVSWIVVIVIGMVFGGSMITTMDPNNPDAAAAMGMMSVLPIILLVFLWPLLAVYTKRWHDRGKDGVWSFIMFVPLIGIVWIIIECGFLRGTEGPNLYGNDPLAG